MKIVLLIVCVFIAGVFFGIWLDWSAWHAKVGKQNLVYELQDYPMANLRVHSGDKITLLSGGSAQGVLLTYPGFNPCKDKATPSNTCTIDENNQPGPYAFGCSSANGFSCPDPGIQQPPTGPIIDSSYGGFVKADVLHLTGEGGPSGPAEPAPATPAVAALPSAANSILAYLSCSPAGSATVLKDPSNNSLMTIPATSNQSVYWISPPTFSLSNFSASNLCSNGNPTGSGSAKCVVSQYKNNASYTVQAPGCSASTAYINTNQ